MVLLLWGAGFGSHIARGQQGQETCEGELDAAEDAYVNHRFEKAISHASQCTAQEGVSEDTAIQALRLISLSYFRQNALVDARSTIQQILSIDPTYEADPTHDPPSYALFVSMVREQSAPQQGAGRRDGAQPPAAPRRVSLAGPEKVTALGPTLVTPSGIGGQQMPVLEGLAAKREEREPVEVYGVRLTFRNQGIERVNGLNVTLWRPQASPPYPGGVNGLALGVPVAGATHLNGISLGLLGVEGRESLAGIGVGGIGLIGERVYGFSLGGLGLTFNEHFAGVGISGFLIGGEGSVRGISIGGLGHAVGGSLSGIQVGGAAVGAGENVQGASIAGLAILSQGGSVYGVQVGGLGVRAEGEIGGITFGSVGAISGGDLFGLTLSGAFSWADERLQGIQASGLALVGSAVQGISAASVVVGADAAGLVVAPGYLHLGDEGTLRGVSVSAFNHVQGRQQGLTLGLLNIAGSLHGVQIGVLNYAGNNPLALRLLPGLNINL